MSLQEQGKRYALSIIEHMLKLQAVYADIQLKLYLNLNWSTTGKHLRQLLLNEPNKVVVQKQNKIQDLCKL